MFAVLGIIFLVMCICRRIRAIGLSKKHAVRLSGRLIFREQFAVLGITGFSKAGSP